MIVEGGLPARVVAVDSFGPTLKRFRLAPTDRRDFPTPPPGGHVLVTLRGTDRVWKNAYSLVTPAEERGEYAIVVRRARESRGGSHFLHDRLAVGHEVEVSAPANLFPIASLARKHILIGGGIGITPFLSYLPTLRSRSAVFELHQFCSEAEAGSFRLLLGAQDPSVRVHGSASRPSLDGILADQPLGTHVYTCGPARLMDAVEAVARRLGWPRNAVHRESFAAAAGGDPFSVRLARSGATVEVGASQTLLEALESAGIDAPCMCRGGVCGVCLVSVTGGEPDHRDHVLSDDEKAEGRLIATCVSRSRSASLVIDL